MFHRRKLFYTSRSIELDEVKGCLAWQRPARVLNRTARRKLTLCAPSPSAELCGEAASRRWFNWIVHTKRCRNKRCRNLRRAMDGLDPRTPEVSAPH